MYALLNQVLELRTPKCDDLRTDGAPSGGRTHTGRILSPLPLPLGYRGLANYLTTEANLPPFLSTDSSIGRVSFPVNVFCWLGW